MVEADLLRQKLLEYVGDVEKAQHMQDAEIGHRIYVAMKKVKWKTITDFTILLTTMYTAVKTPDWLTRQIFYIMWLRALPHSPDWLKPLESVTDYIWRLQLTRSYNVSESETIKWNNKRNTMKKIGEFFIYLLHFYAILVSSMVKVNVNNEIIPSRSRVAFVAS